MAASDLNKAMGANNLISAKITRMLNTQFLRNGKQK